MQVINCLVSVTSTFCVNDITNENRGNTVTMVHSTEKAQHTNRFYKSLHLARRPNIIAAAAIAGIDPAIGAIKGSIRNINKVLRKYSRRATFKINHSNIKQGIILSANDVVAEFEDLEKYYLEFIDSA
ncbi:hypothetical protein G6F42_009634 [Rhizopus arrhizus]|nr:hypothetical protein G6F42_009634 [Rhizopus arrhizus]